MPCARSDDSGSSKMSVPIMSSMQPAFRSSDSHVFHVGERDLLRAPPIRCRTIADLSDTVEPPAPEGFIKANGT